MDEDYTQALVDLTNAELVEAQRIQTAGEHTIEIGREGRLHFRG